MPLFDQKTFVYWVLLFAVFFSAVVGIIMATNSFSDDYWRYFSNQTPATISKPPAETVHLQIEFGNGKKRAFRGRNAEGLTALAALRMAGQVGNFGVETDERGELVKIADIKSVKGQEWKFLLNGQPARDLPGHIEISSGDRVVFRYE